MITWGIFAALTAFVTNTVYFTVAGVTITDFAVVRFLLGMGEAGFFPGLILYFTYWFPARHHARMIKSVGSVLSCGKYLRPQSTMSRIPSSQPICGSQPTSRLMAELSSQ